MGAMGGRLGNGGIAVGAAVLTLLLLPGRALAARRGAAEGEAVRLEVLGEEAAPAATEAPLPPATVPEEDRPRARAFVKGELTRVGATKLLAKDTRLGVRAGYEYLDRTHYLLLVPEFDYRHEAFFLGVGVPLHLEIFGPDGFANAGRIRPQDYDTPSDFAKIVRHLQYGGKEQRLFLRMSQLDAATIGHGTLVRRYFANLDIDTSRVGFEFDAYNDFAGFEAHLNDVVAPFVLAAGGPAAEGLGAVTGVLVFVKPLALFSDALFARSLSLGASYAAEWNAPLRLAPPDAIGRIVTDAFGRPVYEGGLVDLAGVDAEFKVVKTESVDIKPFVDFSVLRAPFQAGQGGWGATVGALGRFNVVGSADPDATVHALRAILELRYFAGNYLPGYFDTFYEVQKYAYRQDAGGTWRTKYQAITAGDPALRHLGVYAEFTWAPQDRFGVSAAVELSTAAQANNLYLHFEVPTFRYLQFFFTVHKRGVTLANLGSLEGTLLVAAGRLQVLPILWLNGRLHNLFVFDETQKIFTTELGVGLDVELGWEF
ncbi:MAG: hypothetical protein D6729_00940 [Deltaproteobacteria bacterium]|nr:MAG: hypothetical protein D6729_00940 [Deltaproteobacteria bacterium]